MLQGKRVAILIGPQFHDEESTIPRAWLQERGAAVDLIALERGELTGKFGRVTLSPDLGIAEADPGVYDGLIIPGGGAPERLRVDDRVLAFVRRFWQSGRPLGAICHGPQVLISADLLAGVTATCYVGIRDDIKLAGAHYVDREVCVDGPLITSRKPEDLPAFNQAFGEALTATGEAKLGDALSALALAISREKGAQEFYAGVAAVLTHEALRNKFNYLALTEAGHFDQLSDLYEKIAHQRPPANLMATEISGKSVSPQITATEALDLAIGAEQKAYDYYRQLAHRAKSDRAREMFEYLAAEEMEHKRLLSVDKSILQGGQGHFQWATHFDVPPGMEDLW